MAEAPPLTLQELKRRKEENAPWVAKLMSMIRDEDVVRARPRDPDEWDWLKSKGVPERLLGPRWEGPGPVPRYPPGKGPKTP